MGRISEAELERLKNQISIVRLVEAAGIGLKKHGAKDLVGHCPFHDDKTPSLVITPKKNLWHCLGACNTGGSVVDWVMRREKVSFRHAVELLRADVPGSDAAPTLDQSKAEPDTKPTQSNNLALSLAVDPKADEADLLNQVVDFYHATLKQAPEAREYLKQRGLDNNDLINTFKLGFANRTLGYRLPDKTLVAGKALRARLCKLGLLRTTGHEHLRGSLVIPICDEQQNIQQLYGRKLLNKLRPGTAHHLYLPGPQRGVFNAAGLVKQEEVILCEALIDALTFWAAGYRNVTASYGVNGFTKEHLAFFKQVGIKRVLIAYDRDEAGDKAADKLATELQKAGFACFRILFPKGMDANQYAMSVKPAQQSLGLVISKAHWLGNGKAPALNVPCAAEPESKPEPVTEPEPKPTIPSLAAETTQTDNADNPATATEPVPPASVSPVRAPAPAADLPVTVNEREVILLCGPRRYRVRGLTSTINDAVMKINLLVSLNPSPKSPDPSPGTAGALHIDTLDLYSAKHRNTYAISAAAELGVTPAVIQHDLGRVLLALEGVQDNRQEITPAPTEDVLNDEDEHAALDLLRDPDLITRISDDITATGLVGEPVNGLVSYLAAISRKLPQPLAIIIQSTSAAGKSALMDAVLDLVPEEDRVHYSAMTGQSLFYLGETDLKHRILGIAEEEGVRQASYALKLLQSQGELTIASTGKDPDSGKLITEAYRVEGPVMLLLTTTAIDIDEELLNRCLVLTVNESREQTRLIQQTQRQARTLSGLQRHTKASAIKALHRNAQRLLQPLAVVNPYAEQLTFMDERPRTRRDHQKYLTLIDAIALLHQYQREIKYLPTDSGNKPQPYVEVTLDDIALANRLAHTVLGRSLDELPPVTRSLLGHITDYVNEHSESEAIARHEVRFTQRGLRNAIGWGHTQLKTHLARLRELEYLLVHCQGQRHLYELAYNGPGKQVESENEPFFMGLLDVEKLGTISNRSGQNGNRSGQTVNQSAPGRGVVGGQSAPGRGEKNGAKSCVAGLLDEKADVDAKMHVAGDNKKTQAPYSYNAPISSSLAAKVAALAAGPESR